MCDALGAIFAVQMIAVVGVAALDLATAAALALRLAVVRATQLTSQLEPASHSSLHLLAPSQSNAQSSSSKRASQSSSAPQVTTWATGGGGSTGGGGGSTGAEGFDRGGEARRQRRGSSTCGGVSSTARRFVDRRGAHRQAAGARPQAAGRRPARHRPRSHPLARAQRTRPEVGAPEEERSHLGGQRGLARLRRLRIPSQSGPRRSAGFGQAWTYLVRDLRHNPERGRTHNARAEPTCANHKTPRCIRRAAAQDARHAVERAGAKKGRVSRAWCASRKRNVTLSKTASVRPWLCECLAHAHCEPFVLQLRPNTSCLYKAVRREPAAVARSREIAADLERDYFIAALDLLVLRFFFVDELPDRRRGLTRRRDREVILGLEHDRLFRVGHAGFAEQRVRLRRQAQRRDAPWGRANAACGSALQSQ